MFGYPKMPPGIFRTSNLSQPPHPPKKDPHLNKPEREKDGGRNGAERIFKWHRGKFRITLTFETGGISPALYTSGLLL